MHGNKQNTSEETATPKALRNICQITRLWTSLLAAALTHSGIKISIVFSYKYSSTRNRNTSFKFLLHSLKESKKLIHGSI